MPSYFAGPPVLGQSRYPVSLIKAAFWCFSNTSVMPLQPYIFARYSRSVGCNSLIGSRLGKICIVEALVLTGWSPLKGDIGLKICQYGMRLSWENPGVFSRTIFWVLEWVVRFERHGRAGANVDVIKFSEQTWQPARQLFN